MLVTETVQIGSREFVHNYSDEGFYIIRRNDGVKFADAMDLPEAEWTYTETDEKIPLPPEPELEAVDDNS